MKFNKEAFTADVKVILKESGKEHLMEFAEDIARDGWEIIKAAAKHTEDFVIDDVVVETMDSTVINMIDKIDGKEA